MEGLWEWIMGNFFAFLLVTARVSGIFTFNPIFSRQNVPARVKVGSTLVMSMVTMAYMGNSLVYTESGFFPLVMNLGKELVVGLILGFFVNLILTVIIYAGEVMDTQIGFGMAKAMDPMTGIQMPLFANMFYYLFVLYFFIVGGHLKYVELFVKSYDILPFGYSFTPDTLNLVRFIVDYLGVVLTLAVKFAMPILAAELITEFIIGVMMRAVPTIQIFVLNIQLKIVVGLLVLLATAKPLSDFLEYLLSLMFRNLDNMIEVIGR